MTKWRIRRFIVRELLEEPFEGRDPLAAEACDSLALEQLIDYIEEEFGVAFEDEELVRENFSSIPTLAALVKAKQRARRTVHV
ncbi:MAG: phosphopantetheine-binding protein [Gemmatimonadales bacterium]